MLNKDNICVIMGSYPQDYIDSALMSLTIESFKRQGYDICLVTHAPVNHDIQKACKYFIYSDENELLTFPKPSSLGIFYNSNDISFQTNYGNKLGIHSYCVLANLKNALWVLQNKKYKKFIYVDSDTFINQEDHDLLESKLIEADFENKDFWFMIESSTNNLLLPVTSFFAGDIDHFSNILSPINSPETYLETCSVYDQYGLEGLMSFLFVNKEVHNGHLEFNPPRRLFKSPWLGISSSTSQALIPGLKEPFDIQADIVKHLTNNDSKEVTFLIHANTKNELMKINIQADENVIVSTEVTSGPFIWWTFQCGETKEWTLEILHNDKTIKKIVRTTEEIFWNDWSFFRVNSLEN